MTTEPVKVDTNQMFWGLAREAIRVKLWYDFAVQAKETSKVFARAGVGVTGWLIQVAVWLIVLAVLAPFRAVGFVRNARRAMVEVRAFEASQRIEKERARREKRREEYIHSNRGFSLDAFSRSCE